MFPTLRISFTGIRPEQRYAVLLDIVPVDNKRYRYAYHRSSWLVAGKADPPAPCRIYAHPDSPFSGEQLRKQVVSFEKVKLTNNEMDKNGQVGHNWILFVCCVILGKVSCWLLNKYVYTNTQNINLMIITHNRRWKILSMKFSELTCNFPCLNLLLTRFNDL